MSESTRPTHHKDNDGAKPQGLARSLSSNREAPSPPAPSACHKNTSLLSAPSACHKNTSLSSNIKHKAPNILVDWDQLKDLVERNLGPCNVCKSKERTLIQKMNIWYATTLEINCPTCELKKRALKHEIHYDSKQLESMD